MFLPLPKTGLLSTILIVGSCFTTPITSTGIAYANEVTYPLDETIIIGFTLMLTFGQSIYLSILTLYCVSISQEAAFTSITICAGIASLLSLFLTD